MSLITKNQTNNVHTKTQLLHDIYQRIEGQRKTELIYDI